MPVDYSKFDAIVDSDDEKEEKTTKSAAKTAPKAPEKVTCRNCGKDNPKVGCGKCKTAKYCNADCQKKDWQFHKRICKAPEDKDKEDAKKEKKEEDKDKEKARSKGAARPTKKNDVEVCDDEDEKFDWYRHRETKLPQDANAAPQRVEPQAAAPDGYDTPSYAHGASEKSGSVWNKAGTWEERDVMAAARKVLEESLVPEELDIGQGVIRLKDVTGIEGSASGVLVRGTPRMLFDLSFKIGVEVCLGGRSPSRVELSISDFTGATSEDPEVQLGTCPGDIKELVKAKVLDRSAAGFLTKIFEKLKTVITPALLAL